MCAVAGDMQMQRDYAFLLLVLQARALGGAGMVNRFDLGTQVVIKNA